MPRKEPVGAIRRPRHRGEQTRQHRSAGKRAKQRRERLTTRENGAVGSHDVHRREACGRRHAMEGAVTLFALDRNRRDPAAVIHRTDHPGRPRAEPAVPVVEQESVQVTAHDVSLRRGTMEPVARFTEGSVRARVALAADLIALGVFVLVGVRSHHEAARWTVVLRTAVPFGGAWVTVAAFVQTYQRPTIRRLVKTWAIAVPAGVVLRAIWVGSKGTRVLVFLLVAMAFTLLFLLAGRVLARAVTSRLRRRRFV
jgi:hypothetical protein